MIAITRQERWDDAKRGALIEAAVEECASRGFEGASYNRIIERSGLSKGTVYYYFDNKESLLCTVMREIFDTLMADILPLDLPDTKELYWEKLGEYHRRGVDFIMENPLRGRLMLMLSAEESALSGKIQLLHEQALKEVDDFLLRGQELGAVRRDLSVVTIRRLMHTVRNVLGFSFFDGWTPQDFRDVSREKVEELILMMLDLSRRMLTPREEGNVSGNG
ncbi:MAG: TetR/AcrR family transcriptional regulator [Fretibacterium sp.]|nr:TetR/AcrR family transcriptional regulator [Fretibacterium sp.]